MDQAEAMRKHLREKVIPGLNIILDAADELLQGRREEGGSYQEEPTIQERMLTATMLLHCLGGTKVSLPSEEVAEVGVPPPPSAEEYKNLSASWRNLLDEEEFDLEAWNHLEELLTGNSLGQEFTALLFRIGVARRAAEQEEGQT